MSVIRVLIVDGSVTIRAMLEEVLSREIGVELVGASADAASAVRMVHDHRPDVATLDIAIGEEFDHAVAQLGGEPRRSPFGPGPP